MYRPIIEKKWIQGSIRDSFSGMYLTMLSIIQGVALSLLVSKFFSTPACNPNTSICEIEHLLMSFLTFLIIIIFWHSYFWLAVIAAWTPLIWDSLFMFSIGAIELSAINSIGSIYWFYFIAFMGIVGGAQYLYNVARLPEEAWDDNTKDLKGHVNKEGLRPKDIGAWICKYKTKRGWKLIAISLAVLYLTLASNKLTWLRVVLYFGILYAQLYSIKQHLGDQRQTLEKLV
jgi:hypothetical protein